MRAVRKAYTIIEMIWLTGLVVIIMAFGAKMSWTLLREIPMIGKRFNTQASVQSMLDNLRKDVETAGSIQLSIEEGRDHSDTLTVDSPQGRVLYTFAAEQMQRAIPAADPNTPGQSAWMLPDVRIAWQIQQKADRSTALEIQTWHQRTFLGRERIHFQQSNHFFVGLRQGVTGHEE